MRKSSGAGDDAQPPAGVIDIDKDAVALYAGFKSVTWGSSAIEIGGWSSHQLPASKDANEVMFCPLLNRLHLWTNDFTQLSSKTGLMRWNSTAHLHLILRCQVVLD